MSADAATPLVTAAKQRHELTRAKAIQAIRELDRAGTPVTFTAVAGQAQISRSWLYSQPDICQQIRQLREATSRSTTAPIPASQRASGTSLLRRLETAHAENRKAIGSRIKGQLRMCKTASYGYRAGCQGRCCGTASGSCACPGFAAPSRSGAGE
jgi:Family of unknown function (DUF6262)